MFYFKAAGVIQNIGHGRSGRFETSFVKIGLGEHQLSIQQLELPIKGQYAVNLACLLLGGLLVNKPDQVVLGKRFRHRRIGF